MRLIDGRIATRPLYVMVSDLQIVNSLMCQSERSVAEPKTEPSLALASERSKREVPRLRLEFAKLRSE